VNLNKNGELVLLFQQVFYIWEFGSCVWVVTCEWDSCCSQMCGTGCSVPCCKSPVYPVCRPTLSLPTSRVASVCVGQHKHQPQRWSCNWQQYSICFGVTLSIELWPVAAACLASYWALVRLLMLATGIAMLMVLAGLTGTLMLANTTHLGNDVRSATDAVQLPTSLIN